MFPDRVVIDEFIKIYLTSGILTQAMKVFSFGFYQRIFEYKLIVSQRKADSWRFENAHERYDRFCREYPVISKRVSIAHIASYLLMSPETLSRVRAG